MDGECQLMRGFRSLWTSQDARGILEWYQDSWHANWFQILP